MKNNKQNHAFNTDKASNEKQKVAESDYNLKGTAAGKEQALKKPAHQSPASHSGTRGK